MYDSKEEVLMGLQQDMQEFDNLFRNFSTQIASLTEQLKMLETERSKVVGKFEYCQKLLTTLSTPDVPNMELINSDKPKTRK